jgi:mannose-1-phosphate guanylyltransferase
LAKDVEQAIVLAGGRGTRLKPLTNNRPKPLLPVLGRPCIEYILSALVDAGIGQIFVACGYRADDLSDALRKFDSKGAEIILTFEDEPAGTAGAVKLLESRILGTFVVASGDVLADVDMKELIERHQAKEAFATMALTTVDRPEEFGIVGLDPNNRIVRFKEKPASHEVFSNLINAGIYILEKEVLEYIPEGKMFDFSKNLFPGLLEMGKALFGAPIHGMWKDIGRPSDLIEANIEMASKKGKYPQMDGIDPPVHIGLGTEVEAGSIIRRSVLGESIHVRKGAEIIDSLLMDRCEIGSESQITKSALGMGCVIGKGSRLIDCVLDDGTEISPGTTLIGEQLD